MAILLFHLLGVGCICKVFCNKSETNQYHGMDPLKFNSKKHYASLVLGLRCVLLEVYLRVGSSRYIANV